jgi:glutaredoxin
MCICAAPRTPLEGVTVYGSRQTKAYQEVCRFFEDRGVRFDRADIEDNQTNLERVIALSGQQDAPVIEIGKQIFIGFDSVELDRALP